MKYDIESLNENQRIAVEWNKGALLVLAGPGSGKTRVLTMRVARLLMASIKKRFRVLGLTFTNKAAAEMRNRVEEMVPECGERVLLTTFHSFCADILRQHGNHVGLMPDFTILNQDSDREAFLCDAIDGLLNDPDVDVDKEDVKLLPVIDRLLSNCVLEKNVISLSRDKEFGKKISMLYAEYNKQLIENNSLDFPSLLILSHKLLTEKPVIAKQIRTMYPHVCVDEFQDTNVAQYRILQDIVGDNPPNLFVVADDDQIIYQWNGATPERLKALREEFKMSVVQLPANYRCPNEVIILANNLIRNNLERAADKEPLYAIKQHSAKNAVRVERFQSVDEELKWVANDIHDRHGLEPGSCVVLGRTRKLLQMAVGQLENSGLYASLATRKSEFTSAPFRWLHAILRLANGRADREQVRRACKAFYELEGVDLQVKEIVASSARFGGDCLKAWFVAASQREGVETKTLAFLDEGKKRIVYKLDFLGFINRSHAWFDEQEQKMGGQQETGFVDYTEESSAWAELQNQALGKYGSDELTLNVFLQELDLSEKSAPIPDDAIRCLTIHTSKGMEFEHVYLVGMAEDQLPSFQSIKKGDNSREMQEERRNCFVAITRSQSTLTLTFADNYFGWSKKPSRFLGEMGLVNV